MAIVQDLRPGTLRAVTRIASCATGLLTVSHALLGVASWTWGSLSPVGCFTIGAGLYIAARTFQADDSNPEHDLREASVLRALWNDRPLVGMLIAALALVYGSLGYVPDATTFGISTALFLACTLVLERGGFTRRDAAAIVSPAS